MFTDTVAPLADALMHLVHGDPDRATDAIALPGVERLGGSAAQREIVEDTTIYCAIQAGRRLAPVSRGGRRYARRGRA